MRAEVRQRLAEDGHAERIRPRERPLRIVDAFAHRRVDVACRGDSLRDHVRGFVGEHRDGAQHRETGAPW